MNRLFEPFFDRQGVVILDGGLATELEARGVRLDDALWSARLLRDDPEAIGGIHLSYLEAGADCITSAAYQATLEGFESQGAAPAEAEELLLRSDRIALEARDRFWQSRHPDGRLRPLVAAGVGPYGASLADGSEFRGDYGLDQADLVEFHERRWRLLAGGGADLLACETLPSAVEARALLALLGRSPKVCAWFCFSCRDEKRISDGTLLAEVAAELDRSSQVVGIGVNCTAPRLLPSLIRELAGVTGKPIVVYPNAGEEFDADTRAWRPGEAPVDFAVEAPRWALAGARLIGGCCRTGPDDIRRLRRALVG